MSPLKDSSERAQGLDPTFFGSCGWYLPLRTALAIAQVDRTECDLTLFLNDRVGYLQSFVRKSTLPEVLEMEGETLCHNLVDHMPASPRLVSLLPWARGRPRELRFSRQPGNNLSERHPALLPSFGQEHFRRFYYDLVMSSEPVQRHESGGKRLLLPYLEAWWGDEVGMIRGSDFTQLSSQMLDLKQIKAVAGLVSLYTLATVASVLEAWDALHIVEAGICQLMPRMLLLLRTGSLEPEEFPAPDMGPPPPYTP